VPALRALRAGGLPADAAALLVSGQEGGSLPFAVLAVPLPGSGERARVAVRVELDGSALLAAAPPPDAASAGGSGLTAPSVRPGAPPPLRTEIYLYALDERGRIGDSLIQVVEADLPRIAEALAGGGIALGGELALLPGGYSLRVLARVAGSAALGLRALPLVVPEFKGGAAILPPLLPAAAGAWLEVEAAGGSQPDGGRPALASLGVTPTARGLLAPGAAATLEVAAWLPGGAADAATTLRLEARPVAAGDGRDAAAVGVPSRVTGRRESGLRNVHVFSVAFEAAGLAPGEYELAAVFAARDATSTGRTRLLVAATGGAATWAQLDPAGGGAASATGLGPDAAAAWRAARGGRRRAAAGPIQSAFRDTLRLLAAGETARAATTLRELEVSWLGGAKAIAPPKLAAAELDVVTELADADAEVLVPVLLLYQRLYHEHRAAQRPVAAAHTGEMAFALAGLYAERGGEAARPLAARLYATLAAGDADRALPGLALRALQAAAELDPANELALLCLAVEAERRGFQREASGYLERLRRLRPAAGEVRLRHALTQARLGARRESLRQLEELIGDDAASGEEAWVLAVAHQELAGMLLEAERPDAAERTARAGLARFPDDEKLALLLALALDVQGQAAAAREALAAVAAAHEDGAAPRRRYGQLPAAALAAAGRALEQSAAERLPSLAAALGGGAPAARPGGGSGR
jgi:hypothetical protein